jgi:hypothetical protein
MNATVEKHFQDTISDDELPSPHLDDDGIVEAKKHAKLHHFPPAPTVEPVSPGTERISPKKLKPTSPLSTPRLDSVPPRNVKTPKIKPTRLVLCFDGTGNKFRGDASDTNIVKIYKLLERTAPGQFHYYQREYLQGATTY